MKRSSHKAAEISMFYFHSLFFLTPHSHFIQPVRWNHQKLCYINCVHACVLYRIQCSVKNQASNSWKSNLKRANVQKKNAISKKSQIFWWLQWRVALVGTQMHESQSSADESSSSLTRSSSYLTCFPNENMKVVWLWSTRLNVCRAHFFTRAR